MTAGVGGGGESFNTFFSETGAGKSMASDRRQALLEAIAMDGDFEWFRGVADKTEFECLCDAEFARSLDLEYEDVEHDEDFAGADGELWAQHLAGEFASMD